ncbi:uncharacterized protein CLUP02_10036 [Colletotrichum lupini]|uniref:Transmembrane protein n=1 Tax=Colletotrichum lupini TaxID=145971 RepID=A0A9Q8SVV6_9PEZI|nr:uncharacterized protein CLUP02_10036 [Colletotrichum lupini]UQC84539.1 hypothetical protein CLUP02_10036 [Colletotrichum lupini]
MKGNHQTQHIHIAFTKYQTTSTSSSNINCDRHHPTSFHPTPTSNTPTLFKSIPPSLPSMMPLFATFLAVSLVSLYTAGFATIIICDNNEMQTSKQEEKIEELLGKREDENEVLDEKRREDFSPEESGDIERTGNDEKKCVESKTSRSAISMLFIIKPLRANLRSFLSCFKCVDCPSSGPMSHYLRAPPNSHLDIIQPAEYGLRRLA